MSRLTYEECESLLASTTDLLNTWARESSVTQAYDEKDIRGVVDRLWSNLTLRISKVERERDEAIVGAYRHAANLVEQCYVDEWHSKIRYEEILKLTPQSALDAVRAERDEAILGAYRAAADIVHDVCTHNATAREWEQTRNATEEILALAPQSALDAVERDRREIAETALLMAWESVGKYYKWPTAADVIAKVKRA